MWLLSLHCIMLQMATLKKAAAFFTLFIMMMSWIMEGEVVQKVHAATVDGPGYGNDFFITYCTRVRTITHCRVLSPSRQITRAGAV
jgi:hypothetical protein